MGTEHKGFTEHGPNALPYQHRDIRTPYDRSTDRMRKDSLRIISDSKGLTDLSIHDAAKLAEKLLAIALRDDLKRR